MGQTWADDSTRVAHVVILTCFCFIALVAVVFRLWARKIQRSRLEMNDYLCIVGLVCSLFVAAIRKSANYDILGAYAGVISVHNAL